tara:strand:- start:8963 stop:9178 length:216 start_codon:yes stop_codon:yes gene_type:complete
MTILELSTALGIVIAGIAGLMKASACKKIECGLVKGCVCEREIETTNIGNEIKPKNDFDKALQMKDEKISK